MFSTDTLAQYQREIREMRERKAERPLEDINQQSLVEAHLPFVIRIARGYEYTGLDLLDLIQEGNVGLLRAAEKFDPSREVKFSTYAVHWIKESIRDALSRQLTSLSSSSYKYQRLQHMLRAQQELQERSDQEGTKPLAEYMGTSSGSVLALINLQQGMSTASLDVQTGEHAEDTLGNMLEENPEHTPEYLVFLQQRNEQLQQLLSLLTKTERQVILLRYGLKGEEQTYDEIAQRMQCGVDKISSLERRALFKMSRVARLKHLQDFI